MSVSEYLNGRKAFDSGSSVRDPNIARRARAEYERDLRTETAEKLRSQGLSMAQAQAQAQKSVAATMQTLAALHNPDMIAGGKDKIADFGDRGINSRIGAQWNKGDRLAQLDRAAQAVPEASRSSPMNAKLARCK